MRVNQRMSPRRAAWSLLLLGLLQRTCSQGSPSATPSSSATASPWQDNKSCDAKGNCFVALSGSFTWQQASTSCVNLGVGWALATITDAETGVSVLGGNNDCFGRIPGGGVTSYWIGLHDPRCCLSRPASRQNRT
jgi:hypothetical protein